MFLIEQNNNLDKLGKIILWCNEHKKNPVLFTYGLWFHDDKKYLDVIEKTKKTGNFRIKILIDKDHECFFSSRNISNFLHKAKEGFIFSEIIYISNDSYFPD